MVSHTCFRYRVVRFSQARPFHHFVTLLLCHRSDVAVWCGLWDPKLEDFTAGSVSTSWAFLRLLLVRVILNQGFPNFLHLYILMSVT